MSVGSTKVRLPRKRIVMKNSYSLIYNFCLNEIEARIHT